MCVCVFVWCCVLGALDYYILALPRTTSRRWVGGAAGPGPSILSVPLGWPPTRPTRGTQWSPTWGTRPPLDAVLGGCCGVRGLAPPHLCLDVSQKILCSITIPVQLLWYFGLLCCVSKSLFYLSCFCTVCWYFSLESSVNRSTMSLL